MQRRDFIIKTGTVLTATAFLSAFGGTQSLFANSAAEINDKEADRRPNPADYQQAIMKAIAIGINAPSPHNTQSWKFKIIDDNSMLLYVDENRFLPQTDPTQRQIHMGAGCFIETLCIGVTSFGYTADVAYFPEGYSSKEDFGKKPVAKINLSKSAISKDDLESYIVPRHTNRKPYTGDKISKIEFDVLMIATGNTHSKINFVDDDKKFEEYKRLLIKAMDIESYNYPTHEESRIMTRLSAKERAEKRDGLSMPQVGFTGIMIPLAEMTMKGGPEKWHRKKNIATHMKTFTKAINSSKGFVTFTTSSNEIIDWVKTGRDFVRFSLAQEKYNLYNNPHTQISQEYEIMHPITTELNKLENISEPSKIQLILRIGRAKKSYYSYRRYLNDFIVK